MSMALSFFIAIAPTSALSANSPLTLKWGSSTLQLQFSWIPVVGLSHTVGVEHLKVCNLVTLAWIISCSIQIRSRKDFPWMCSSNVFYVIRRVHVGATINSSGSIYWRKKATSSQKKTPSLYASMLGPSRTRFLLWTLLEHLFWLLIHYPANCTFNMTAANSLINMVSCVRIWFQVLTLNDVWNRYQQQCQDLRRALAALQAERDESATQVCNATPCIQWWRWIGLKWLLFQLAHFT